MMTSKRLAELKQAVTDFPHVAPTNTEAREMIEEIERLRAFIEAHKADVLSPGATKEAP